MKRVVFDIETEAFSEAFRKAETTQQRRRHAPKMRLTCVYREWTRTHHYFLPDEADQLIGMLQAADKVISFNGKRFDLLVLRSHHGLKGRVPARGDYHHIDLHQIMSKQAGFLVSLNSAVKINFDESKHTSGREMANLDIEALKVACRSDVDHTYRLWQCFNNGTLRYPLPFPKRPALERGGLERGGYPGACMPQTCPQCGGEDVFLDEDDDFGEVDMDSPDWGLEDLGLSGMAYCGSCGAWFSWGLDGEEVIGSVRRAEPESPMDTSV